MEYRWIYVFLFNFERKSTFKEGNKVILIIVFCGYEVQMNMLSYDFERKLTFNL